MNRFVLLCVLAGCPKPPAIPQGRPPEVTATNTDTERDKRLRLIAELQDDILSSYESVDIPDETSMFPPRVGQARIGVGPGDVILGRAEIARAPSRWPLRVGNDVSAVVRSKRLDIHLSLDKQASAAWMSDEISWRFTFCGRTAVIPLRMTALYAHDGDRWVEVFEHLSYGRVPEPDPEGKLIGRAADSMPPFVSVVEPDSLRDELSASLNPLLTHQAARFRDVLALDDERSAEEDPTKPSPTLLLSPDPEGEWHGDQDLTNVQLVDGKLSHDEARIGTVGRSGATATVAYWVGNFTAALSPRPGVLAGNVRLRGTFVFEKRKELDDNKQPTGRERWIVVQGHLSQPIGDTQLAHVVFGSALESTNLESGAPLAVTCDDGRRDAAIRGQTTPAVEP